MKFNNLPYEIYSRILERIDSKQDIRELMSVCKACHLSAKELYYAKVLLLNNHQSFLTFLKNEEQGGIIPGCIKTLHIEDFWDPEQELDDREEFSYMIQSLKRLEILEIRGRLTKWYLDVMVNDMKIEDLKQIKRIIISSSTTAETNKRYYDLIYKLRDTITNLRVVRTIPQQLQGNNPTYGLHYLSELKSLTHLEIRSILPEGMEFFTILRACPKLQSLILYESSATPPSAPSKELVVCKNLKRLKLQLFQFPRHYVTYITSCLPPTINFFELYIRDDGNNWVFSGHETMLVDQFSAHLSKIKDLKLILSRKLEERTQECVEMMARTWRFANNIRGHHRREKMITRAEIQLVSDRGIEFQQYCHFNVRKNKYFDFNVVFRLLQPFSRAFINNVGLEDLPTDDMEDASMINSIKIRDGKMPASKIRLLQFIQYMVKRCTRLSRIFVPNTSRASDYIVFAPVATTSAQEEEEETRGYVTTPTEENILYASYSWIALDESFLKPTLKMFPNIQTVRIDGCIFEEPVIRIDLCDLKNLHRIELDLRQIYQKRSVLFTVNMESHGTVNYFFKRLLSQEGTKEVKGPFDLVSMNSSAQQEEDCVVVNIFCVKADEMAIHWRYANEERSAGHQAPCTTFPLSDLLDGVID